MINIKYITTSNPEELNGLSKTFLLMKIHDNINKDMKADNNDLSIIKAEWHFSNSKPSDTILRWAKPVPKSANTLKTAIKATAYPIIPRTSGPINLATKYNPINDNPERMMLNKNVKKDLVANI